MVKQSSLRRRCFQLLNPPRNKKLISNPFRVSNVGSRIQRFSFDIRQQPGRNDDGGDADDHSAAAVVDVTKRAPSSACQETRRSRRYSRKRITFPTIAHLSHFTASRLGIRCFFWSKRERPSSRSFVSRYDLTRIAETQDRNEKASSILTACWNVC